MNNAQLTRFPIFNGLTDQQLSHLQQMMEFCSLPADMVLFEQGSPAEYLYILLEGEVAIHYKPYDGPSLIVAKIYPGNVFGWSVALNRDQYGSSAITVKDCSVYRIKNSIFTDLCGQCPNTGAVFMNRLASVISERIENSHQEILLLLRNGMDINGDCWRSTGSDGNTERIHT